MDRGMPSQASHGNRPAQRTSFFPASMNGTNYVTTPPIEEPQFDVISWYPYYQNCQRFFVNHAQHSGLVQSVAAFINIKLPFQQTPAIIHYPSSSSIPNSPSGGTSFYQTGHQQSYQHPQHQSSQYNFSQSQHRTNPPPSSAAIPSVPFISLIPFIRRLVITGFDNEGVMHGFFGNDWQKGLGSLQEIERRNFMFAAKSSGWAGVKDQYDIAPDQTVPFMKPLARVQLAEIERSEKTWSEWLAMEDWMVGPRAPENIPDQPATSESNDTRDDRNRTEMRAEQHYHHNHH